MGAKCEKCQHEQEGWIPKTRLDEEIAKTKAAKEQEATTASERAKALADLEAARTAAAAVAGLEAELGTLRSTTAKLTGERALMRAGLLDDEGLTVAQLLYAAQPEAGRPPIEQWIVSEAAPKAVRAYLPTAAPPAGAPPPAPPPKATAPPGQDSVVPGSAGTGTKPTPEQVRAAGSDWAANREAILAAVKQTR